MDAGLSNLRLGGSECFLGCQRVAKGQKVRRKAATGGIICREFGDVGKARRTMPRTLESYQIHERKERRAFDSDGTKEEVVKRSTESRELDP